jgi:hypothetical protein
MKKIICFPHHSDNNPSAAIWRAGKEYGRHLRRTLRRCHYIRCHPSGRMKAADFQAFNPIRRQPVFLQGAEARLHPGVTNVALYPLVFVGIQRLASAVPTIDTIKHESCHDLPSNSIVFVNCLLYTIYVNVGKVGTDSLLSVRFSDYKNRMRRRWRRAGICS